MWTKKLPEEIIYEAPEGEDMKPNEKLEFALASLDQLGLITGHMTWDGAQMFACVSQTVLGRSFVNACKLRSEEHAT